MTLNSNHKHSRLKSRPLAVLWLCNKLAVSLFGLHTCNMNYFQFFQSLSECTVSLKNDNNEKNNLQSTFKHGWNHVWRFLNNILLKFRNKITIIRPQFPNSWETLPWPCRLLPQHSFTSSFNNHLYTSGNWKKKCKRNLVLPESSLLYHFCFMMPQMS